MMPTPPPDRPLVVVVDDMMPVRLVVVRALTDAGYDVRSAPDGSAAAMLILGLKREPSVVVADVRMPIMGGEQLASWLGHHFPRVPVIFISGFLNPDPSYPGPVLSKPFTSEQLCDLVRQVVELQQGPALSQRASGA